MSQRRAPRSIRGPLAAIALSIIALISISNTQPATARLTNYGLPNGQTIAPSGRDYILFPPPRRRKRKSAPLRRPLITASEDHPFYTLRDSPCRGASLLAVRDANGPIGVVRTLPASQLSSHASSWESTIVLFHGGPSCPWSRDLWRVWATVTRRLRATCLVAIDGAQDSMMNYNMMVLGFPTVLRVVNEWPNENFRGNRTVDDMVKWAVWVGAMAPLDVDGIDSYESDLQRFEVSGEEVEVLDLDDERHTGINWTLWGANFVSICNVLWIIVRATRGGLGRFGKRGTAGADGGEEEEE